MRSLRLGESPDRGHNFPSTLQVAHAKRPDTNNSPNPPSHASLGSIKLTVEGKVGSLSWKLPPQAAERRPNMTNMRAGKQLCVEFIGLSQSFSTPLRDSRLCERKKKTPLQIEDILCFIKGGGRACISRSVHHTCIHTAYAIYSQTD